MINPTFFLLILAAVSGGVHIVADRAHRYTVSYVAKPLTLVAIFLSLAVRNTSSLSARWILGGLVFSLLGDVFLMMRHRRFAAGLGAFLLAHLCYIGAFTSAGILAPPAGWIAGVAYASAMIALLWRFLGGLRGPVVVYMGALLAMAVQAWGVWNGSGSVPALCGFAGALLFVISDTVLGLREFRKLFLSGQIVILGTYYTAQILISLSVPF